MRSRLLVSFLIERVGDLALIENPEGVNRPQSRVRDAGFTSKWTGLVNTGRHIGTNLLFVERIGDLAPTEIVEWH
jgi:hypothetical protein